MLRSPFARGVPSGGGEGQHKQDLGGQQKLSVVDALQAFVEGSGPIEAIQAAGLRGCVAVLLAVTAELRTEHLVCSWCGDDFEQGDWASTDCCSCDPVSVSALPSILKAARRENEETMREWEAEVKALASATSPEVAPEPVSHVQYLPDLAGVRRSARLASATTKAGRGDDGCDCLDVEHRPDCPLGGEQSSPSVEAMRNVVEAAKLVEAVAGGDDWWSAHASLYAALDLLDAARGGDSA